MEKKGSSGRKSVATRKPGKTGATGIIKKTDKTERPVRTGKTGATGIIRETGTNGMSETLNGVGAKGSGGKIVPGGIEGQ